jgi:flagellar FliL protein
MADDPETEDASDAKPKKKSKKLILIVAAAVLVLGGGGGGYFFFMHKGEHADEMKAPKKEVAFVDVREMTVNLQGPSPSERPQYLKLKVALEVSDPKAVAEIQPMLPRIEDAFQVYVRELRPGDLEGSAGLYRLKEELLRRVNIAVYPAHIDAVLFKEAVVQ